MNVKRYIIASFAAFILFEIFNFVIHGLILAGAYEATAAIWRSDMDSIMWIIYLVDLVKAFLFVYIFIKGYQARGWHEGLRFGFIIGLFVSLGTGFESYATYPIPFSMALQWFIYGVVQFILCGILTALIYKPLKK